MSGATHVGFADESNWNKGRFRSLGLVTAAIADLDSLNQELRQLLRASDIKEFKWKHLDGAKERFVALKLCNFVVEKARRRVLRIDVLVWDIEDSRHKVPLRDDIANLQRMYYHLFRNVLRLRWPNNAIWRLHPDEHTAMDWDTVQDCLANVSVQMEVERPLFTPDRFRVRLRKEFGIEAIQPVASSEHPLLQLADLFAGLAVFSREKFTEYQRWLASTSRQPSSISDVGSMDEPSRSSRERFQVLKEFDQMCKQRKLGVSLKSRNGLWTPNPENPLNFWLYEPQHPEDRAPTRK